jgi:hypothetical protein
MKKIFILVIGLCFLFPAVASADMEPKPAMTFYFVYQTLKPTHLLEAVEQMQVECRDKKCIKSYNLNHFGTQGIYCTENNCRSQAYPNQYDKYHKLKLTFSDKKIRESNIFTKQAFQANYQVLVTDSGLVVNETSPFVYRYSYIIKAIFSAIIVITIEMLILLFYVISRKKSRRLLLIGFYANLISIPFLWVFLFFAQNFLSLPIIYLPIEILAIVFEGLYIAKLGKGLISRNSALVLSLVMNIASWVIGNIITIMFVISKYYF